eukprot:9217359-Pyramimonas_sp.AAC.1
MGCSEVGSLPRLTSWRAIRRPPVGCPTERSDNARICRLAYASNRLHHARPSGPPDHQSRRDQWALASSAGTPGHLNLTRQARVF